MRNSMMKNATNEHADMANKPRMSDESQPSKRPRARAIMSGIKKPPMERMPQISTPAFCCTEASSRSIKKPRVALEILNGRLRRKIMRQSNASTIKPPKRPMIRPRAMEELNSPMAVPRCSGGKALNKMLMVNGCTTPAPAPRMARKKMSDSRLHAKMHNNVATMTSNRPEINSRLRPSRLLSQPDVGMSNVCMTIEMVTTHWI